MAALTTSLSVASGAQTIKTLISFTSPTQGIAASPTTNKIYVVAPNIDGETTDNLAVIDGTKDVLVQNIAVPQGALFVTVDYFRSLVYVAGCNFNLIPAPCTVTSIDGNTNKVLKTYWITQTPGFGLTGIVANPLNGFVYIANGSDNVINVLDGWKSKPAGTITLNGNSPFAIAINPILDRLYVPFGTNLTGVVDARAKKLLSTTNFGTTTVGAAVNLLNGHVFITDSEFGPSTAGALDYTGKVLAGISVDDSPLGVDVDPITNLVFVASTALDTIDVIDGSNNTLKTTVSNVPADYIAVNLATEKIYVSGRTGVTVLTEK